MSFTFDIITEGNALVTQGLTGIDQIAGTYTINGIALVTNGLIWLGIWSDCDTTPTNVWTDC